MLGPSSAEVEPQEVPLSLPLVVATAASGSTVIAVVDRRPPLAVSNDAGRTWREAGGGLPPGRAIAIAEDDPDHVLYAARNRLYESQERRRLLAGAGPGAAGDRGARAQGSLNSPRATITALPPTSTRSSCSAVPSARANSVEGRPISTPWVISISSPKRDAAVARQVHRERPGGRAGRRVLGDAAARREHARAPLRAFAGEAVGAEQPRKLEERADVRPQRRQLLHRAEPDVDELRAVVVVLDRQLRPLEPQRREQRLGLAVRLPLRQRLEHLARRRSGRPPAPARPGRCPTASRAGSRRAAAGLRARRPCRASGDRRRAARPPV